MNDKTFMWAQLLQLGSNMWNEEGNTRGREHRSTPCASPIFLFDRAAWDSNILNLKAAGVNTLILDIGEAMRYESHPEIAVKDSWTHEQMSAEIDRLRALGFELVPKLNFSACHDVWLGVYSRMLSTPTYYEVCRDIIDEVCALFKPKYFHLGMDEETFGHQKNFEYAVVRNGDLWWKDFYFLVECVERNGARPWVWSDYIWNHPDIFIEKMPREVLQSNWYYSACFHEGEEGFSESNARYLAGFELLERHGYDQVPTGSIWSRENNFERLTEWCAERIAPERFLGMMQTVWERVDPAWMHKHNAAIEHIKIAKALLEGK